MRKLLFLLLLTASMSSFAARILPNGKLADLEGYQPPQIKIDGKVYQTAPGLQVRGVNNTLLMPPQVPQKAVIWYQVENNTGFIWRVWIVTPDEARALAQREKDNKAIAAEIANQ